MTQYEAKTKRGYPLDEVVSALIKSLRRGMEEESLFWAQEIEESGYHKYIWKRLLIFCTEDIGLIDPDAIVRVNALAQAYESIRKNQKWGSPWRGISWQWPCCILPELPRTERLTSLRTGSTGESGQGGMTVREQGKRTDLVTSDTNYLKLLEEAGKWGKRSADQR